MSKPMSWLVGIFLIMSDGGDFGARSCLKNCNDLEWGAIVIRGHIFADKLSNAIFARNANAALTNSFPFVGRVI